MTSDRIVPLFGEHTAQALEPVVDEESVAKLAQVLEMARTGEMRGVAIVVVTASRATRTWYSGEFHELVGAVSILQHRVICRGAHTEDDDLGDPAA